MFVNRSAESGWLEARWRAKDAQLLIVYGKRRVGKTALLFKSCVWSSRLNMRMLGRCAI